MKSPPSGLATHYDGRATTLGYLLKITRTDNEVFGWTSADADDVIDGVTYRAAPGLDVTSIEQTSGLSVDALELTTLDDGSTFTRAEILSGVWNNAAFVLAEYNFESPADGVNVLLAGTTGNVKLRTGSVVVELLGLQQYLQQPVGAVTSKTCRARLGDTKCTKSLAAFTHTASVTSVASNQVFTASSLGQAADYFGNGLLTWTSGPSAGLSALVRTFASGGVITLSLPMLLTVEVGHSFSIVAGCRKRLAEDCATKFNNVLNFQGEPHLPGIDQLTA